MHKATTIKTFYSTESGLFEELTDEQAQSTSGGDFSVGNFSGYITGGNANVPTFSTNSGGNLVVSYSANFLANNTAQAYTGAVYTPTISLTQGSIAPSGSVSYILNTAGAFTNGSYSLF